MKVGVSNMMMFLAHHRSRDAATGVDKMVTLRPQKSRTNNVRKAVDHFDARYMVRDAEVKMSTVNVTVAIELDLCSPVAYKLLIDNIYNWIAQ